MPVLIHEHALPVPLKNESVGRQCPRQIRTFLSQVPPTCFALPWTIVDFNANGGFKLVGIQTTYAALIELGRICAAAEEGLLGLGARSAC